MRSELLLCDNPLGEPEPEPEPSETTPYTERLLEVSDAVAVKRAVKMADWLNDFGDSRIMVRPHRITSRIGGAAFAHYAALSVEGRRELESRTTATMEGLGGDDEALAMINYMPVFFAGAHLLQPQREWYDGLEITLASDKIHCPQAHRVLLGGLATMLYHLDYSSFERVE